MVVLLMGVDGSKVNGFPVLLDRELELEGMGFPHTD